MYLYLYTYIYICVCICMYIFICTYVCLCVFIYICICMRVWIHIYIYIMRIRIHICVYMSVYLELRWGSWPGGVGLWASHGCSGVPVSFCWKGSSSGMPSTSAMRARNKVFKPLLLAILPKGWRTGLPNPCVGVVRPRQGFAQRLGHRKTTA